MRGGRAARRDRTAGQASASAGLNAADLLALASGIAATTADPGQAERCLALVRDGITPTPAAATRSMPP